MTVLGTAASCALLAKKSGYSLNPAKMLKNIKKSFLANVKFHDKEVITIGAGSCIGGLAGGYMVDKILRIEKQNDVKQSCSLVIFPYQLLQ